MKLTSLLRLISLTFLLCRATNQVSLTVRPSSSQVFARRSVSLRCEGEGGSGGWTLKRNTSVQSRTQCGVNWGRVTDSTCHISLTVTWDSGVYWCESRDGSTSNTIKLTVTEKTVILQSPVLPVMAGENVTLRCITRKSSELPTNFYKDDILISSVPAGHMTINQISTSDEGSYWCHIEGHRTSERSFISITGEATTTPPSTSMAPPRYTALLTSTALPTSTAPPTSTTPPTFWTLPRIVFQLLLHTVVFCPYVICTFLIVSMYGCRPAGKDLLVSQVKMSLTHADKGLDNNYDDDVIINVTSEHFF